MDAADVGEPARGVERERNVAPPSSDSLEKPSETVLCPNRSLYVNQIALIWHHAGQDQRRAALLHIDGSALLRRDGVPLGDAANIRVPEVSANDAE